MDKPLKILSVGTYDSRGGAARAAYRIHCGVNERMTDVRSEMFVKHKRSKDVEVHSLKEFTPTNVFYKIGNAISEKVQNVLLKYKWNKYPNRENIYMSDMRGVSLHGALQRLDYDVLHMHWVNLRFLDLNDLRGIKKPIVWTLHDSWQFCGVCHYFLDCKRYQQQCGCCPFLHSDDPNDLSHQIWQQKAEIYKDLDIHVVTPSHWLGACAAKSGLFSKFPVTVIPNGLDTDVFRPTISWEEKQAPKPIVLYGAMGAVSDKIKGFANLLSALKILEQQGDCDFELVVFGAKESDLSLDLKIPVRHVGYITDTDTLVDLYNQASVMVVPSLTENLSCVIMESLSCGTPVVAFNIGGNGDMIDHQQNGYLAREMDNADLAAGIRWCLENNADGHLSRNAREKVLNNYTEDLVVKQYVELYKSVKK